MCKKLKYFIAKGFCVAYSYESLLFDHEAKLDLNTKIFGNSREKFIYDIFRYSFTN